MPGYANQAIMHKHSKSSVAYVSKKTGIPVFFLEQRMGTVGLNLATNQFPAIANISRKSLPGI